MPAAIQDEFSHLVGTISRARLWQLRHNKKGLCKLCGRKRFKTAALCRTHQLRIRLAARKLKGNKAWRKGSQGRKPLN